MELRRPSLNHEFFAGIEIAGLVPIYNQTFGELANQALGLGEHRAVSHPPFMLTLGGRCPTSCYLRHRLWKRGPRELQIEGRIRAQEVE